MSLIQEHFRSITETDFKLTVRFDAEMCKVNFIRILINVLDYDFPRIKTQQLKQDRNLSCTKRVFNKAKSDFFYHIGTCCVNSNY